MSVSGRKPSPSISTRQPSPSTRKPSPAGQDTTHSPSSAQTAQRLEAAKITEVLSSIMLLGNVRIITEGRSCYPFLNEEFQNFMIEENNLENLKFLTQLDDMALSLTSQHKIDYMIGPTVVAFAKRFIYSNSPLQVNLTANIFNALESKLGLIQQFMLPLKKDQGTTDEDFIAARQAQQTLLDGHIQDFIGNLAAAASEIMLLLQEDTLARAATSLGSENLVFAKLLDLKMTALPIMLREYTAHMAPAKLLGTDHFLETQKSALELLALIEAVRVDQVQKFKNKDNYPVHTEGGSVRTHDMVTRKALLSETDQKLRTVCTSFVETCEEHIKHLKTKSSKTEVQEVKEATDKTEAEESRVDNLVTKIKNLSGINEALSAPDVTKELENIIALAPIPKTRSRERPRPLSTDMSIAMVLGQPLPTPTTKQGSPSSSSMGDPSASEQGYHAEDKHQSRGGTWRGLPPTPSVSGAGTLRGRAKQRTSPGKGEGDEPGRSRSPSMLRLSSFIGSLSSAFTSSSSAAVSDGLGPDSSAPESPSATVQSPKNKQS